ncbi:collagen alpha-2(IX) chain-like isoform X2 [Ovis aries]|uniref:collagen alpha-2(IX) chain-like isoform X2 n=1 Tax=Ovis aries TaxID=9940 RepID=UPI0029526223|nr:collagen alpha-2(IX) chain-like isoform X2 [Ovis aries]
MALQARCRAAAGQPAPGLEPTLDPEPRQDPLRDWATGPGGGRRPLRDRGAPRTRRKLQTEDADTRMELPEARDGVGGFFPFPGTALPGQFPGLRSPTCKHPPSPPRPGPAALCVRRGLEPSRSPLKPEAAGRPPGRLKSGAMGLVSSRAGRTALPSGGPRRCGVKGRAGPRVQSFTPRVLPA